MVGPVADLGGGPWRGNGFGPVLKGGIFWPIGQKILGGGGMKIYIRHWVGLIPS